MRRHKSRLGVEDLAAREAALARRLDTLRMLATMTGATGVVAFVVAILSYRNLVAALIGASPIVVTMLAIGLDSITGFELRKVRLLLEFLDVHRRRERASGGRAGLETPNARGARGRVLTLAGAQNAVNDGRRMNP